MNAHEQRIELLGAIPLKCLRVHMEDLVTLSARNSSDKVELRFRRRYLSRYALVIFNYILHAEDMCIPVRFQGYTSFSKSFTGDNRKRRAL